jgi:hypothetical protein
VERFGVADAIEPASPRDLAGLVLMLVFA